MVFSEFIITIIIIFFLILFILILKTETHFHLENADSISWYLKAERLLSPRQCAGNFHMDIDDWAAYRHPCFHCFHNSICLRTVVLTNFRKRSGEWNSTGLNFRNAVQLKEGSIQSEITGRICHTKIRPLLKLRHYYMQSKWKALVKIIKQRLS